MADKNPIVVLATTEIHDIICNEAGVINVRHHDSGTIISSDLAGSEGLVEACVLIADIESFENGLEEDGSLTGTITAMIAQRERGLRRERVCILSSLAKQLELSTIKGVSPE